MPQNPVPYMPDVMNMFAQAKILGEAKQMANDVSLSDEEEVFRRKQKECLKMAAEMAAKEMPTLR